MYIKQIDLLNIRSYENASMTFSKGINMLLGPNNSGKSSILRCIQTLQKNAGPVTKEDIRKGNGSGKIRFKIDEITDDYYATFNIKNKERYNENFERNVLYGIYSLPENKEKREILLADNENYYVDVKKDSIEIKEIGYQYQKTVPIFKGFSSMEDENNFIYPFLSKRKTQYYSGQGGREAAFNIGDDLKNLPAKIQNLSNGSHPFHSDFAKYCDDILGFQIAKIPGSSSNNDDTLGIFATTSQTIKLESMGEGVANILGLLAILLTEDDKLFLIEEIENDIHPEALKKLLDLILEKSKSNQFIISTHSNIVLKYLATAPESKIFYTDWVIKKDSKNRTSLPTTVITELENTPSERLRVLEKLGYDLFDFDMYKSYLIFEESSAESIVKNFLIPQFVSELENSIKTIAANGVDDLSPRFNDFLRLFVFIHTNPVYHQKAWVLADGDEAGRKNIRNLREKFSSWPSGHFINLSKNDFEEYYPEVFRDEFKEIDKIGDKLEKRKRKAELTNKVINWINEDIERAKELFSESAAEIIEILGNINERVSNKAPVS